ncbi:MAG: CsbD family protein [Tissierellia bacterium]|nr:CsbD family protein [Tissierellia bacterium]
MNKNIFEGKWEQVRGLAKETWGKLTDDDLEKAKGSAIKFKGMLQERLGYTEQQADGAIKDLIEKMSTEDIKKEASKIIDIIKK